MGGNESQKLPLIVSDERSTDSQKLSSPNLVGLKGARELKPSCSMTVWYLLKRSDVSNGSRELWFPFTDGIKIIPLLLCPDAPYVRERNGPISISSLAMGIGENSQDPFLPSCVLSAPVLTNLPWKPC